MTFRFALVLAISINLVSGCGSPPRYAQEGATMADIYDRHMSRAEEAADTLPWSGRDRSTHAGNVDLAGYTRDAARELDALFRELPNPKLVMYVFPHPTGEGVHVPGYSVSFPMYEQMEYALPGEVAP